MKPDFDSGPTFFITAGARVQQRWQAEPQILSGFLKYTCCLCKAINSPFTSHLSLQHHSLYNAMLTHANGSTGGVFVRWDPESKLFFLPWTGRSVTTAVKKWLNSADWVQKGGFFALYPPNSCVSRHWSKTLDFQATVKNVISNLRWYYRKHWLPR